MTEPPIPYKTLQSWKSTIRTLPSPFLAELPKIELHIHLEGALTPSLRFRLAQRNNLLPLYSARLKKSFHTLSDLQEAYNLLEPRSVKGVGVSAFFEAYYGSMEVLLSEDDFFELAMEYFRQAKEMRVRYCEVMFDVQAHTRRGVEVATVMRGLERAKIEAETTLNVKSTYIAAFLRDLPLTSALTHLTLLKPYSHLLSGIGLDSNEFNNPPSKFYPLFTRARDEGYHVTCHCDVAQPATLPNIRQVVTNLGERIDHGLDAALEPELVALIKEKGVGMTICPWAYVRHCSEEMLFGGVRGLFDAGIKITINSDSPAYVEDNWLLENLQLLRLRGGDWTDAEFVTLMRNAGEICWAGEDVKREFGRELDLFAEEYGVGTADARGKEDGRKGREEV